MLKKINQPLTGLPVPENKQWILYAGRFVYAKGLDILLEAFKLVSDKTTAHLVLMGEGPLKSKIADEFKAANLGNRVHIIEFQINPLPWMREADVLVLPSRREGLGNGIIEAMACGTQIVATDCPSGPPEILDNGKYGQLVPVENPKALGQALLLSLSGDFHIPPLKLQERANFFSSKKAASIYISLLKKDHQKF
jgi:glycosyltransferase involved in cell wall biosynthesis